MVILPTNKAMGTCLSLASFLAGGAPILTLLFSGHELVYRRLDLFQLSSTRRIGELLLLQGSQLLLKLCYLSIIRRLLNHIDTV